MQQSGFGNWSVSFGGGDLSFGQAPTVATADALLAATGQAIAVHPEQWLWFAEGATRGEPVSPDEAFVLGQCPAFARRDEHIARLVQQLRASAQQLSPIVDRLISRQLLKPLRQYVPPSTALGPNAPAPTRVIRTCRRPESLRCLLDSLLAEPGQATGPIYVVDDSADPEAEQTTRAVVAAANSRTGAAIAVLGRAEREALRTQLLAQLTLPEADIATFDQLLSPERAPAPVPGRAFNWAVLLGAGQTLSILDDDFRFPLKRFASYTDQLELRNSAAYLAAFPDPGDPETLEPVRADPYAEARTLLGQRLSALLASRQWDAEVHTGQHLAELEWLKADRHVRAVIQGTYGSFGVASAANLCGPGQRTLANLLRPPFRLQRLQADPIHYGLDRTRLAATAVSLPWLIDARSLVPATNACGVAEDTLFASLLTAIDPSACFAYVPSLIGHVQGTPPDRIRDSQQPIPFGANHFLAQHLQTDGASVGSTPADRMQHLAARLQALSARSDATLGQQACRWWNEERANTAASLSTSIQQHPQAPSEWLGFVDAVRRANLRQESELSAEGLRQLRQALTQTSLACRIWPKMFDWFAARDAIGRERV